MLALSCEQDQYGDGSIAGSTIVYLKSWVTSSWFFWFFFFFFFPSCFQVRGLPWGSSAISIVLSLTLSSVVFYAQRFNDPLQAPGSPIFVRRRPAGDYSMPTPPLGLWWNRFWFSSATTHTPPLGSTDPVNCW